MRRLARGPSSAPAAAGASVSSSGTTDAGTAGAGTASDGLVGIALRAQHRHTPSLGLRRRLRHRDLLPTSGIGSRAVRLRPLGHPAVPRLGLGGIGTLAGLAVPLGGPRGGDVGGQRRRNRPELAGHRDGWFGRLLVPGARVDCRLAVGVGGVGVDHRDLAGRGLGPFDLVGVGDVDHLELAGRHLAVAVALRVPIVATVTRRERRRGDVEPVVGSVPGRHRSTCSR
jgi:hypothetical protein